MIEENIKGMRELQEAQKRTDEQLRKTDEEIRKTDEEIRKTSEEIRKVNKSVAGISDGFGRMTEGFAIVSIEEVFKNLGIYINTTLPRAKRRKNGESLELDLLNLAKSEGDKKELVIVAEVKTYLRTEDIDNLIQDILKFYEFFEEYRARELIGVIAFMNYAKGAKEYAEKNGFYLLSCSEDLMKLANKEGFKPKLWRYNQ
ncbi:MAG: hypothetical protein QME81_02095 [bacterium]|nr:hypothetical protein [bacterium]